MIFLALTVLSLQVADFLLVWLADTGSKSDYWSLDNNWTQVDIFVLVFALFYFGKNFGKCLSKDKNEPSCTSAKAEQPPKQQENTSSTKWQTKSARPERRVSFNNHVETVELVQLEATSSLRAEAPAFVSQVAQEQGLRAGAPAFVPHTNQGLRAQAPMFVPQAQSRAVPPPPPPPTPPPPSSKALPTPPGMDDDNVGTVLFRSARSADIIKEQEKVVLKPKEVATKQSKWQPKERTIWKSSHVYGG